MHLQFQSNERLLHWSRQESNEDNVPISNDMLIFVGVYIATEFSRNKIQ